MYPIGRRRPTPRRGHERHSAAVLEAFTHPDDITPVRTPELRAIHDTDVVAAEGSRRREYGAQRWRRTGSSVTSINWIPERRIRVRPTPVAAPRVVRRSGFLKGRPESHHRCHHGLRWWRRPSANGEPLLRAERQTSRLGRLAGRCPNHI